MKNVKDQVADALATVTENVSDSYPTDWATLSIFNSVRISVPNPSPL